MERRHTPEPEHSSQPVALRQVARGAAALAALGFLYVGLFWLSRQGGGCAKEQDDDLATIGALLMVSGVAALAGAALSRLTVAGIGTVIGAILLFVGVATGIGCLR